MENNGRTEEYKPVPKLVNVTEFVVNGLVNDFMTKEKMCMCDQCRLDVIALTLNNMPPKYVVTGAGKAMEAFRLQGQLQNRMEIYQAMLQAAQLVKERPRHNHKFE